LKPSTGGLSAIIGMLSAIDRNQCSAINRNTCPQSPESALIPARLNTSALER
jgi:hypothetical protein